MYQQKKQKQKNKFFLNIFKEKRDNREKQGSMSFIITNSLN